MNSKLRKEIDINQLNSEELNSYPDDLLKFTNENGLKIPRINSGKGKALCIMARNLDKFFNRKTCDEFVKKLNIKTDDSIQLFNKHEQCGIKTGNEKGKYYLIFPYELSNKYKMRKNFKYDGSEEQKNMEIEHIKDHIKGNYIDVPNTKWQLGHKNPDSSDNSNNNLVLQPPIQGKYRDNYIFLDTLTKIPTPKKLKDLIKNRHSPYTKSQLKEMRDYLNTLDLN